MPSSNPCQHCKKQKSNRPRGLCRFCYYNPAIRAIYVNGTYRTCKVCGRYLRAGRKGKVCAICFRMGKKDFDRAKRDVQQELTTLVAREAETIERPWEPTAAVPGSYDRVVVMAARVQKCLPLWVNGDAEADLR